MKLSDHFPEDTPEQILQTLSVLKRELELRQGLGFDLKKFCHPKQFAFINDSYPYVTSVTTRRAGKTWGCGADLLHTAQMMPNMVMLYITLTRVNAKRLFWPVIKTINNRFKLGGEINESDLSVKMPNGAMIYLTGIKDRSEIENYRGMALKKIYLDESQSMPPYVESLIDDVLDATMIDHDGVMRVMGTPGPVPVGYFYDIAHSDKWHHHFFSIWDNPHIINPQKRLDLILERRGITVDHPSIQREWFGKWELDSDSLVFHYDKDKNHYDEISKVPLTYILGIDIGFEDSDALALLGWSPQLEATYLVEEIVKNKQGLTELVEQIEDLRRRYEISKIVMDMGGLGKKIGEEIIRRYRIPIQPADKTRKIETIELMNDAMRTSKFKAKKDSRFAQDCILLEFDQDKTTPDRKIISDRFHSDICDAVLYGWRESYAFSYQPEIAPAKYGSKEWALKQTEEMEHQAEEYFKAEDDLKKEWGW